MGPNYGSKGDNSKCGTDAFHFCLEVFGQIEKIGHKIPVWVQINYIFIFLLLRGSNTIFSFVYKNENISYTKCPISTHPAMKITLAC